MPAERPVNPPLVLEPIFGPPTAPIRLVPPEGEGVTKVTVGRLPECQVQLPETEKTVSRVHCSFESIDRGWQVTDLGSRHGTFLNNVALVANAPQTLREGDGVRIGPWTFRVVGNGTPSFTTLDDTASLASRVVPVTRPSQEGIDRRRLQMLIKCSKLVHTAQDEHRLAAALLDPVLEGTGFARVAVVRATGRTGSPDAGRPAPGGPVAIGASAIGGGLESFAQIEVLAAKAANGGRPSAQFSRSLLQAASHGQIVELRQDEAPSAAVSIMALGTATAMAVPVLLDQRPACYLYLDSRRDEPTPHGDAAAFCQAIAEMCGLALSSMQRARLEQERVRYTEQMEAGMAIQRQLLPKPQGRIGTLEYAFELRPGRYVAGDLVDFVALSERRVAFFIGDVSGKGLPAAILMATTQSYLNAALRQFQEPARVAAEVNAHLAAHAPDNKFVSLWLGMLDLATGVLDFVDAGHGFMLVRDPDAGVFVPGCGQANDPGGPPLRVFDEAEYVCKRVRLSPGSRIVLFSDGVVEQADPNGEQFGTARAMATLADSADAQQDVRALVSEVLRHAGTDALSDDLTVASLTWHGP
ncbi:MAG: SpoIIE family protein phosphatase [Phycisphaerales bacterium]